MKSLPYKTLGHSVLVLGLTVPLLAHGDDVTSADVLASCQEGAELQKNQRDVTLSDHCLYYLEGYRQGLSERLVLNEDDVAQPSRFQQRAFETRVGRLRNNF